jgi:hypothetical protein
MGAGHMSEVVAAVKPCHLCRSIRCPQKVRFYRNIGMLFVRQTRVITAHMCKTFMTKNYWQFMGKNLLLGLGARFRCSSLRFIWSRIPGATFPQDTKCAEP